MASSMTKAETILGGYVTAAAETGLHFNCARCGKELTDPASIQHGWGPWCRDMANEAFAMTIPGDAETTLAHLAGVHFKAEALTEALEAINAEIVEGMASGRQDWRGVATVLIRLIAYSTYSTKAALCNAVEALGYTTLAAVAREEASPSVAEVTVVSNRLVLKTKRNAAANNVIKAIPGRRFDPIAKVWSFPPTEFRAVLAVVSKYFPMTKLDVLKLATEVAAAVTAVEAEKAAQAKAAEATMAAKAAQAAPLVTTLKAVQPVQPEVKVSITETVNGYNVVSPYNAKFVADLKTSLTYKARSWNGAARCWWVSKESIEIVKALVAKHYGEAALAA